MRTKFKLMIVALLIVTFAGCSANKPYQRIEPDSPSFYSPRVSDTVCWNLPNSAYSQNGLNGELIERILKGRRFNTVNTFFTANNSLCNNVFEFKASTKNLNSSELKSAEIVFRHNGFDYGRVSFKAEPLKASEAETILTALLDRLIPAVNTINTLPKNQISTLNERCHKKDEAAACVKLGNEFIKGTIRAHTAAEETRKAQRLFVKACQLKNGLACELAGRSYLGMLPGVTRSADTARLNFETGCQLDNGFSCLYLGRVYEIGKNVKASLPKAKDYYGKACHLGKGEGCVGYAKLNRVVLSTVK